MKTVFNLVAVGLVACAACLAPVKAQAQANVSYTNQNKFVEYQISGNSLAANGFTNFSGNVPTFIIKPGYGVAINMSFTNANSSALSNVIAYLFYTVDGTNFSSAANLSWTKLCNGQTAVVDTTNFVGTLFDGCYGVGLAVTNGDAAHAIGFGFNGRIRLSRAKIN